jgi:hypothetical protein
MTDDTSTTPDEPTDEAEEPTEAELLRRRASRPNWSISRLARRRLGGRRKK